MNMLLQAWPVIHPAIAAGAVAAGLIPVLIHLWHRRRFRHVPWAAMRFLLAANRRSARRLWIERLLLLLLRVAVITVFGLAVARPYLSSSALTPLGRARVHRVVVLDNSLSMRARASEGRTRFDQGKAAATQIIQSFPEQDAVSLVTTARPAEAVVDYPAFDRRFVRETLGRIEPTWCAGDTQGALNLSRELVRSSEFPAANKAVYVISDFPRREWVDESGQSPTPIIQAVNALSDQIGPSADNLTFVHVGSSGGTAPSNVGITRLATRAPLIGLGLPIPLEIEAANFANEPLRGGEMSVLRDGLYFRREPLPRIEAGDRFTARITTMLSSEGSHAIEARLAEAGADDLAEDDVRFLSLEARRSTPVLLVDGRPGATRWQGEAGFLATALAPGQAFSYGSGGISAAASDLARISPLNPRVISEGEFSLEPLDEYAVVILCNVGRLTEEGWARLTRYVAGGGGLLVTVGDLVNADNYNRFGFAEGAGVLPVEIESGPVEQETSPEMVGFSSENLAHPIVAPFKEQTSSGLFMARVERWLPLEIDRQRGETVLGLTTGAPVLVTGTTDGVQGGRRGRVAVFGTSVNLSWTNLPAKGDFVSLMYNLVAYLSPRREGARNLTVGDKYEQRLSARESSLPTQIVDPDGAPLEHSLVPDEGAFLLRTGPLERPGVYEINIGAERQILAVNVDPTESDLFVAEGEELRAAIDIPMRWIDGPQRVSDLSAHGRVAEFAYPMFFCVAALLLIEVLAALWFGSPHGGRGMSND
jgi:hypothetical protein